MMKRSASVALSIVLIFCGAELFAQVQFSKARLVFSNGKVLTVEIADSAETQSQGLSGRTQLARDEGMLFVFPNERTMRFWMRDTYIPLSVGFFDKDMRLMSVKKMAPQVLMVKAKNLKIYQSDKPGHFALEVNQGWFEDNKIVAGMTFELNERE